MSKQARSLGVPAAVWPRATSPFDSLHGRRLVNPARGSALASVEGALLDAMGAFAHPNVAGAAIYASDVVATIEQQRLLAKLP